MKITKRGPSLRRHKSTGHAYAKFNGKQHWFGRYEDAATHARFAAFKAEWEASGRRPPREPEQGLTVADLVAKYLLHARVYYRKPDGTLTHEVENTTYTAKPLLALFGALPAADFDLRRLKLVRERMIDGGLSRGTVNNRVWRITHMFGWAAEEELIPPRVYGSLRALRPLKRGRSRAPETEPIQPVAWKHVEQVLDAACAPVRAMILLQWYTGMRPGEVVQMRPADLDRSGSGWTYRPSRHKTEHHGRERVVLVGPRAQEVLRPFLLRVPQPDPERPLFSPQEAMAERHARARKGRSTPLWPSHERANLRKRRARPKLGPGDGYTVGSYRRAIARACEEAKIPHWSPNQLRHAAATRIRKERGLEAARAVLGHASAAMTEVYAELDVRLAEQVMAELG